MQPLRGVGGVGAEVGFGFHGLPAPAHGLADLGGRLVYLGGEFGGNGWWTHGFVEGDGTVGEGDGTDEETDGVVTVEG